ncbi:hypothetical protein HMPREF1219_00517 [Corynebacterium pyruviciproducens ATCC BAA-1742]|uniref:Resolvase/invertase-type recombinase catalytic domain-containing protein n=1 Tax=Corynebacterium pyruviciproducens ATCC BAA-1742 TaxID=1125779 RepID=S2Z746_9CORY|nr:recombinase family protein [Corynebacterium pyruviciproducens]EPD70085.1 hypothetical protein HMPREF1219_00517 [Corynebacterium pyruviciproducens ATCC BAA-1742]
MARIGYQRVSTVDQNESRQLVGVPVDITFTDKASGKDTNRPKLREAIRYSRQGDIFLVHSMDRLARNLVDLRQIVDVLTEKGVTVAFQKENLTFTGEDNAMNNLLLSMLGAVAEFERSLIKERQREGIAIAKKQGKYKGGKPKLSKSQTEELRTRRANGESATKLAKEFEISRASVYNYTK